MKMIHRKNTDASQLGMMTFCFPRSKALKMKALGGSGKHGKLIGA
jgi:hypothetical protein